MRTLDGLKPGLVSVEYSTTLHAAEVSWDAATIALTHTLADWYVLVSAAQPLFWPVPPYLVVPFVGAAVAPVLGPRAEATGMSNSRSGTTAAYSVTCIRVAAGSATSAATDKTPTGAPAEDKSRVEFVERASPPAAIAPGLPPPLSVKRYTEYVPVPASARVAHTLNCSVYRPEIAGVRNGWAYVINPAAPPTPTAV